MGGFAKQSLAGRIPKQSLGTTGGDSTSPPLRGWIVPVGDAIPDRRGRGRQGGEAALRGTHSQAALGNDRGRSLGNDREGAGAWGLRGGAWEDR